jgi:hypothetical protein
VDMLGSSDPKEREAGLIAMEPFVNSSNGRIILLQLGVIIKLKKIMNDKEEIENIQTFAIQFYKKIYKSGDSLLKLGISDLKPFEFDYDEIARIDSELVEVAQKKIRRVLDKRNFKLSINWKCLENYNDLIEKQEVIVELGKEEIYDELYRGVEIFCHNEENTFQFNQQIKSIIIDVNENNDMAIFLDSLLYTISFKNELWNPKTIAGNISINVLETDITDLIEDVNPKYQKAISELIDVCKDKRIPMAGDLNILYFHLSLDDELWKPLFAENQAIVIVKGEILGEDELFIKGWHIVHHKGGSKKDKVAILSNTAFYIVGYDQKNKTVDFGATETILLDDFVLLDIGILKSKDKSHHEEDIKNKIYSLRIVQQVDQQKKKKKKEENQKGKFFI